MTLDPSRLRSLRKALDQSEDLIAAFIGQTGALALAQKEQATRLSTAAKTRDAEIAKAKAAYDLVEGEARKAFDASQAKANSAYAAVATAQDTKTTEAAKALKEAETALRKLQDDIREEFGYNANLFPGATGQTIKVG